MKKKYIWALICVEAIIGFIDMRLNFMGDSLSMYRGKSNVYPLLCFSKL
jgi:hypothetical protein